MPPLPLACYNCQHYLYSTDTPQLNTISSLAVLKEVKETEVTHALYLLLGGGGMKIEYDKIGG